MRHPSAGSVSVGVVVSSVCVARRRRRGRGDHGARGGGRAARGGVSGARGAARAVAARRRRAAARPAACGRGAGGRRRRRRHRAPLRTRGARPPRRRVHVRARPRRGAPACRRHTALRRGEQRHHDDRRALDDPVPDHRLAGCGLRATPTLRPQLQALKRRRYTLRRRLLLDGERHGRGAAGRARGPLRAEGGGRRAVRVALRRGGLGHVHLRRVGYAGARLPRGRAPRAAPAAQLQRGRGAEAEGDVPRARPPLPRRALDVRAARAQRDRHRRAAAARRARHRARERGWRARRRARHRGGAEHGRRELLVRRDRRAAGLHHAAGEGHVRGAVALPRHLRRGVHTVRHHPRLREAAHQARARRLGHGQPRPEEVVSARGAAAAWRRRGAGALAPALPLLPPLRILSIV